MRQVEGHQAEDVLQEGHVDEGELQQEREEHRAQEQPVGEQPCPEERLALEADGQHVEHLRDGQHGEEHGLPGFVARLPVDPAGRERDQPHQGAGPQDVRPQTAGEDALVGRVGRALHDLRLGRLEAQRQTGQAVGDQVHPQDLQRQQRQRHAQEGRDQHHRSSPTLVAMRYLMNLRMLS